MYIIQNDRKETKPIIAPYITLSFMEFKDKQLYLISIEITNGAIKHIRKVNDSVFINGISVINPHNAPKNKLNLVICFNNM